MAALEVGIDLGEKLDKIASILQGRPAQPGATPTASSIWTTRLAAGSPLRTKDASRRHRTILGGLDAPTAALIDKHLPAGAADEQQAIDGELGKLDRAAAAKLAVERAQAYLGELAETSGVPAADIERARLSVRVASEEQRTAETAAKGISRTNLDKRRGDLDKRIDAAREALAETACRDISAALPGAIAAEYVRSRSERDSLTGNDSGAAVATSIRSESE